MKQVKSVYIHIPFCKQICSYCDFPKMFLIDKWISPYLDSLNNEIKTYYQKECLKSIYIGGGTPSCLNKNDLIKLLDITTQFNLDKNYEFTVECNIQDIDEDILKLFKKYRVNRISIGLQTLNKKHLQTLNRYYDINYIDKINLVKKYFNNISLDLMYSLPNQTLNELEDDLKKILKLNIPHLSCYSLMIEPHTMLYNQNIKTDDELDKKMYDLINKTLKDNGYIHYETSNYGKENYFSIHNLGYWNNSNYYGFGLGASGYINNIRYTNTKKIDDYLKGKYHFYQEVLSKKDKMIYEMILGLRKSEGVNEYLFYKKYGQTIEKTFDIDCLLKEKKLVKENGFIYIPYKYSYIANDILVYFV